MGGVLDIIPAGSITELANLASRGRHISGEDDDTPFYTLLFQDAEKSAGVGETLEPKDSLNLMKVCPLPHSFYANAPFVGEKDEDLVTWIFVGCREEVELVSAANQKK